MPSPARFSASTACAAALLCAGAALACPHAFAQQTATTWRGGAGAWTDAQHWSAGFPTQEREATISGHSNVLLAHGDLAAADLRVGPSSGDDASVTIDGARLLLRQDSLIVGERTGGTARVALRSGRVDSAMDVFVGGATATTGRMNRSTLVISGGTFVGLSLIVGEGLGSDATVEVQGSHAASITALESLQLYAHADPSGKPANTTLAFTLDAHGVAPITVPSRWRGLQIDHDAASRCTLLIRAAAVPPRGNITLVQAHVPTRGSFSDLPEGSDVIASFAGRTFHWRLTYTGGASGHDLVLLDPGSPRAAPSPEPTPTAAVPRWWSSPVYPLAIAPPLHAAFPGAEGYGASAVGGRDGRSIVVDNLNDAGPGSLRAALEAAGPRLVDLRAAGEIHLRSPLVIDQPFLTLDASHAPVPGLTLRGFGIEVRTHDVVLRHFRIRIASAHDDPRDPGKHYEAGDGEYALSFTEGAHDDIADHLSLSWSTNKILSTTKLADRITVQWCILSEALNLDGHGYASIVGGNRVTWHHNLFAHNFSRNPRFQGAVDADFRNNVVYDWGEKSAYGEFDRLNFAGNYLKPGPSTTQKPTLFHDGIESVPPHSLWLNGNILDGNPRASADNWHGTAFFFDRANVEAAAPFPAPPITEQSAAAAFHSVLGSAGASPRDATDERIVHEVTTGTGHITGRVP